jgi:hypothetical protein
MELLPFNAGSVPVVFVAPLMLTLIVDGVRLSLIDDNSCATRSGNFYNNADAHQPKGKNRKYDYRHPGVIGRVSTPGNALRIVGH